VGEESEELMEEWAPIIDDGDLGRVLREVNQMEPGMLLWLKPRAGNHGFLTEIIPVDGRSDLLVAQLFNTTTAKRFSKWQKVWFDDHPNCKMRQPRAVDKGDEWNEYWIPVSNKPNVRYKPWIESAAFADFVPIVLDLKPDDSGYLNLPKKFHDKCILGVRPAQQPPLPKEEHRDLSWFVDTTTGHPPVDNTADRYDLCSSNHIDRCRHRAEGRTDRSMKWILFVSSLAFLSAA
jgi:hypothetical protein